MQLYHEHSHNFLSHIFLTVPYFPMLLELLQFWQNILEEFVILSCRNPKHLDWNRSMLIIMVHRSVSTQKTFLYKCFKKSCLRLVKRWQCQKSGILVQRDLDRFVLPLSFDIWFKGTPIQIENSCNIFVFILKIV